MIEKKIKALEDFQFTNFTGTHFLVAGEVKRIKFMNQQRFEQHLQSGRMVEADLYEKEDKTIPVILPPVSEETIALVEPVDPIDLVDEAGEPEGRETPEDQEQSEPLQVDPLEGIDPDKPDLPCPPEDRLVIEESPTEEFEEIPIEEWRKEHPDAPELEPAEVPEDLPVEFEEIPIEEQDADKPERLSDVEEEEKSEESSKEVITKEE